MSDNIDLATLLSNGKQEFNDTLEHLREELTKIRAGKASPTMLDSIMVDYYGTPTPIKSIASLGTADARTITIQPWEKKMLSVIERAIFEANLGITPMNDGEFIRIGVPPLTTERRQELVKQVKSFGEDAKVAIRSGRHKMMDSIKKEVKDGYPEDAGKKRESEVEASVKEFYGKIDALIDAKEKDVLKV